MVAQAALLSALLAAAAALLVVPARPPVRRVASAPARLPSGDADPAPVVRPLPRGALRLVAAAGAGVGVLLVVPGPMGLALAGAGGVAVWWRSRSWESAHVRRRRAFLEREVPHVVDLMTAALAAGAAPTAALGMVANAVDGPMAEELRTWTARLDLGADPASVWTSMARHPQLGRLGTTLHRSAESGAPVAAALLRLAEDLRDARRAAVEERVRQVEVKAAVPLGVCLLPSFVIVGVVPLVAGSVTGLLLVR